MKHNPAIVHLRGKTYIAHGDLQEAWEGMTPDDARTLFPRPVSVLAPKPEPKQSMSAEQNFQLSWQVLSSKGDKHYTVTYRNDSYSCSCPGYGWRRKCRHIEGVKLQ